MIQTKAFSQTNKEIKQFIITNKNSVCTKITNYGATLTSLKLPLKSELREIVLGFDSHEAYKSEAYLKDYPYFGAIIGRFANRINQGKVLIDNQKIQLPTNHGKHFLHGGYSGFDKRVWDAEIINESKIKFSLLSKDGDQNFPGNMIATVTYELNDKNELIIKYSATCDKISPINLTSHTYFNFTGGKNNILNHALKIDSDHILKTNSELIPTGDYIDVKETCFDFNSKKTISTNLKELDNYDNCFVLKTKGKHFKKVAELSEEESNIKMELFTDFHGLQIYTGKYINVKDQFLPFSGIALETQGFPDAPNHKKFSHGFIHPKEIYQHKSLYKFHF